MWLLLAWGVGSFSWSLLILHDSLRQNMLIFFLPKILSVEKTPGPNPDAVEPAYGSDLYVVGILIRQ